MDSDQQAFRSLQCSERTDQAVAPPVLLAARSPFALERGSKHAEIAGDNYQSSDIDAAAWGVRDLDTRFQACVGLPLGPPYLIELNHLDFF